MHLLCLIVINIFAKFSALKIIFHATLDTLRYPEIGVRVTGSAMFFSFCDDVIDLPGRPSRFSVDTSLPVEELREDTMEKRVSFYGVLSANVNCMTPLAMLLQVC